MSKTPESKQDERAAKWHKDARAALVGKTITAVYWMGDDEVEAFGWCDSAIMLQLDDGSVLIPQRDDEGNDAGALWQGGVDAADEHLWPVGVKGGE